MPNITDLFPLIDIIALCWFIMCWVIYTFIAEYSNHAIGENSLNRVMYHYRLEWMEQMILSADRISDARIMSNLMQSVTFFASTSIFIIAGIISVMAAGDKASHIISALTLGAGSKFLEAKSMLLITIFGYSFFKYTWALRQYNYASVILAAAPRFHDNPQKSKIYAERAAKILSNAARHFNIGMRGYYFGLAALSWYANTILFMVLSVWVVVVLYRREFYSKTFSILRGNEDSIKH